MKLKLNTSGKGYHLIRVLKQLSFKSLSCSEPCLKRDTARTCNHGRCLIRRRVGPDGRALDSAAQITYRAINEVPR